MHEIHQFTDWCKFVHPPEERKVCVPNCDAPSARLGYFCGKLLTSILQRLAARLPHPPATPGRQTMAASCWRT
jgi:hypothetical protein